MQIETLTIEVEADIITSNWGRDGKFELPIDKLNIQFESDGEVMTFKEFLKWLEHLNELIKDAKG